jgi:glycosyltransferase involved in cell wall biosynthesis
MSAAFDALVVADARFAGGSTAALAADVTAMAGLGMKLGLIFVRSAYLDDARDRANPRALELADLDGVTHLSPETAARAELAFLHHPLVFFRGIEERLWLAANRAVIVTHHAPFRSDGSLEWDPIATRWRARRLTGLTPWFAPISGVVRAQLASFAPLVRQTSADWPNIFEPVDWPDECPILSGPVVTIGRHGRPDPLKFPATGSEIDAALPASATVRVRVLGCPAKELAAKGAHPERWEALAFGAEPVSTFLNSLDIFAYHYHPRLQEAFGRAVVEAALCGRPCLLDPRLEPTFGDLAAYCDPMETADALARLAGDPAGTRAMAVRGRKLASKRYGAASMAERIDALRRDGSDVQRAAASASPPQVLRKLAGLYRRRAGGRDG